MPFVFVYGPDSLQARIYDRLGPSDVVGSALLEGFALKFNKPHLKTDEGLANIAAEAGAMTFGVLYDLTRKQIEMLDGYYGGYVREDHAVKLQPVPEGEEPPPAASRAPRGPISAAVYVARRTKGSLKPSHDALQLTKKGAEENHAPAAFLEMLSKQEVR